jgi:hypothetical protein
MSNLDITDQKLVDRRLTVEFHNGYGSLDPDGEPWPFGYISTDTPQPIFELNVILGYNRDELLALLIKMVVAANAHDALVEALKSLIPYAEDHWDEGPEGEGWQSLALKKKVEDAYKALEMARA